MEIPVRDMRCVLLMAAMLMFGLTGAGQRRNSSVGKGGQNVYAFSLIDVGIRKGIFARHGLDVEVVEFNGGARMQQALAANSIDMGFAGSTDLAAIYKGAPAKAVAAIGGPPLDFGVTVRADGPIRTITDLRAKKIGVTTLASLTAWLTGEMSRQLGLGQRWRDARSRSDRCRPRCACCAPRRSMASPATWAMRCSSNGSATAACCCNSARSSRTSIRSWPTPATVRSRTARRPFAHFSRGWFDTLAYVRANKAESVKVSADVLGHEPALIERLYDQLTPGYSSDGRFLSDNMRGVARAMNEQYGVPESALAALYTEEFLPRTLTLTAAACRRAGARRARAGGRPGGSPVGARLPPAGARSPRT